jgi:hypothetical protein
MGGPGSGRKAGGGKKTSTLEKKLMKAHGAKNLKELKKIGSATNKWMKASKNPNAWK